MSLPARKFKAEEFMAERTVLEERVEHIQNDVADLKKEARRLDDKIDRVIEKVDAVRTDMSKMHVELTAAIGSVRADLMAQIGTNFRWMIGTTLTAIGVVSGIVFGLARYVH